MSADFEVVLKKYDNNVQILFAVGSRQLILSKQCLAQPELPRPPGSIPNITDVLAVQVRPWGDLSLGNQL